MNEETYSLYKESESFKKYVDAYCTKHDKGLFEALDHKTVRDTAKYYREANKDVIKDPEPAVSKMPTCDC